jgi:hypothetical protein
MLEFERTFYLVRTLQTYPHFVLVPSITCAKGFYGCY